MVVHGCMCISLGAAGSSFCKICTAAQIILMAKVTEAICAMQDSFDAKLEAGASLAVAYGRPDIESMLQQFAKRNADIRQVHVYAAGQPAPAAPKSTTTLLGIICLTLAVEPGVRGTILPSIICRIPYPACHRTSCPFCLAPPRSHVIYATCLQSRACCAIPVQQLITANPKLACQSSSAGHIVYCIIPNVLADPVWA